MSILQGSTSDYPAKLSKTDVEKIAWENAVEIGWLPDEVILRSTNLERRKKQFVWRVFFSPKTKNNLPERGGHLVLIISDDTQKVTEKLFGTR